MPPLVWRITRSSAGAELCTGYAIDANGMAWRRTWDRGAPGEPVVETVCLGAAHDWIDPQWAVDELGMTVAELARQGADDNRVD